MTVHDVLAALETLEDGELHVVMTRAQALLLDHPGPTGGESALAVEIVERQEGRLLAAYRALAPGVQRRLLEQVTRLGRTWPVHRRGSPAGLTAASRAPSKAMIPRRLPALQDLLALAPQQAQIVVILACVPAAEAAGASSRT